MCSGLSNMNLYGFTQDQNDVNNDLYRDTADYVQYIDTN